MRAPNPPMTPDELKAILAALGWSQAEAGRQAGLGHIHISNLARGRIPIKGAVAAFFRCCLAGKVNAEKAAELDAREAARWGGKGS